VKELTILDFALGLALLYHLGADGKELRNFASNALGKVELQYRPLCDCVINSKNRREYVRQFLRNLEL